MNLAIFSLLLWFFMPVNFFTSIIFSYFKELFLNCMNYVYVFMSLTYDGISIFNNCQKSAEKCTRRWNATRKYPPRCVPPGDDGHFPACSSQLSLTPRMLKPFSGFSWDWGCSALLWYEGPGLQNSQPGLIVAEHFSLSENICYAAMLHQRSP